MPDKNYDSRKNVVVFTQQIEQGQRERFDALCTELEEYCEKNNLPKPKKQFILSTIFKKLIPGVTPELFFE